MKLSKDTDIGALISLFEKDRNATLSAIYGLFRSDYLSFTKSLSEDQDLSLDSFQEAVIGLYENLMIGRITQKDATLKTYLFAIGKNHLLKRTKKANQMNQVALENTKKQMPKSENAMEHEMTKALSRLGDKCREILKLFYYNEYSIEAIMTKMEYANENTVKAHKSRCLAQLRKDLNTNKD